MQIKCPHCAFSREVPEQKIPARSELATCPKCGEKFRFRSIVPEQEPLERQPEPEAQHAEFYGPDARLHDEPSLAPHQPETETPEPSATTPDGKPEMLPPFEDLEHFGFFPGMSESIKRAMLSPKLFFEIMPLAGLARPLVFALLLFEFYLICTLVWHLTGLPALSTLTDGLALLDSDVGPGPVQPVDLFVVLPMMFVVNLFLSTGLLHGVLLLLRAAPRGFEATFRATAYSYATLVLAVLPYGYLAGWLWSLVISVIGCAAIHRTQVWRIIAAYALVAGFIGTLYFSSMQLHMPGA